MRTAPLLYFCTGTVLPPGQALDAGTITRRTNVEGPEGKLGVLMAPVRFATSLEYLPESQRWIRVSGDAGGELWIGVDQRSGHVPGDFARSTQRAGHGVVLGDGHVWEIPPARLALGGTGLPRRRVLREGGAVEWEVEAAYRSLSDSAARLWNARQGHPESITADDLDAIVGEALAVNYRLGKLEAIALGLLTDDAVRGIVDALLDWPVVLQLIQAEKKSPPPVT